MIHTLKDEDGVFACGSHQLRHENLAFLPFHLFFQQSILVFDTIFLLTKLKKYCMNNKYYDDANCINK